MNHNLIIERLYARGRLTILSPLVIGSGEDERTDIDVIRDGDGQPFIPGTSLAGVLRHFLEDNLEKVDNKVNPIIETVFGKTEKDSTLSLLIFSDALPRESTTYRPSIRDGIKLDYITRTVAEHKDRGQASGGAKYDYEVIEPGSVFVFRMELVIRQGNQADRDKIYDAAAFILKALENGCLRVGAKTRRGFGKIRLDDMKLLKLEMNSKQEAEKWLDFLWDFQPNISLPEITANILPLRQSQCCTVTADFTIPYSLLIRHYNADPSDDDTTHLMSGGKYVIPGTSWNGALRHSIYSILNRLLHNEKRTEEILENLFGYIKPGVKKAAASRVIIDESIIDEQQTISYTRNRVDRFTGGVVASALFTERPVYGGTVTLNIIIKEPQEWEKGLLLLALLDIAGGIQPVGGGANIGRGILRADPADITVDNESLTGEIKKRLFKELHDRVEQWREQ